MPTRSLWIFGAGPLVHPSTSPWEEMPEHLGQEHPQPEFLLQVSRLPFAQDCTEQLSPPSPSPVPFASVFSNVPNTSVLHWRHVPRPDCSDELPDTLLLLRWEGASCRTAELFSSKHPVSSWIV